MQGDHRRQQRSPELLRRSREFLDVLSERGRARVDCISFGRDSSSADSDGANRRWIIPSSMTHESSVMKVSTVLLVVLPIAALAAVAWGVSGGGPTPVVSSETGAGRSGQENVLVGSDSVKEFEHLRTPQRIEVVPALAEGQIPNSAVSVASYGALPSQMKGDVRDSLSRSMARASEHLREAKSDGKDILREARMACLVETRRAQMELLSEDEYLLLDPGAVNSIWPSSPEGFIVITHDTLGLPSGKIVDVVMVIEISRFEALKSAREYCEIANLGDGVNAAYEFNGMSDKDRFASIAAQNADQSALGALTGGVRRGVFLIRKARYAGMVVDSRRGILLVQAGNTKR